MTAGDAVGKTGRFVIYRDEPGTWTCTPPSVLEVVTYDNAPEKEERNHSPPRKLVALD